MKDLNCLKKYTEYQEASYNFRLGFALSNGPDLHRAYLVTIPFDLILAVSFEYLVLPPVRKDFIQFEARLLM